MKRRRLSDFAGGLISLVVAIGTPETARVERIS